MLIATHCISDVSVQKLTVNVGEPIDFTELIKNMKAQNKTEVCFTRNPGGGGHPMNDDVSVNTK